MSTQKKFSFGGVAMVAVFAAAVLFGTTAAHAQTTTPNPTGYSVPAGYQSYSNGIYYNSSNGMYYNPSTNQYSTLAPLGPSNMNQNGSYVVPNGYSSYGATSYYYNTSTGYYYDPSTGFYSTNAPVNTGIGSTGTTGGTVYPPVVYPGVPNTGAGGNAATTLSLIMLSAVLSVAGVVFLTRYSAES